VTHLGVSFQRRLQVLDIHRHCDNKISYTRYTPVGRLTWKFIKLPSLIRALGPVYTQALIIHGIHIIKWQAVRWPTDWLTFLEFRMMIDPFGRRRTPVEAVGISAESNRRFSSHDSRHGDGGNYRSAFWQYLVRSTIRLCRTPIASPDCKQHSKQTAFQYTDRSNNMRHK
jgi:hypothetical protein